jgi:hypothetical protein
MVLSVGGSFAYFARNARCTVTTDLLVWYSNTQNDFSPGAAIFSLQTLVSPNGRNVNYDEKQLTGEKKCLSCSFYLYRFRKYVSCGFLIINFCNPRVHYETPCISLYKFLMKCYKECVRTHVLWRKRWDSLSMGEGSKKSPIEDRRYYSRMKNTNMKPMTLSHGRRSEFSIELLWKSQIFHNSASVAIRWNHFLWLLCSYLVSIFFRNDMG